MPARARTERSDVTRELILTTAERLFAEHGVFAVSNRQISEAAGQGNNAAVGYHFGSKLDLVSAIVHRHHSAIDARREPMVAAAGSTGDVRAWAGCLVRPTTDHLEALGNPTWFARFSAQVVTDPALRGILAAELAGSASLQATVAGLNACLPDLPPPVRDERDDMVRLLMVHVPAERERAVAEGLPTARATWFDAGTGLIDAIVNIWTAPA